MASGHVNRTKRPNTWLHRPKPATSVSPCQPGAVHTWHIASFRGNAALRSLSEQSGIGSRAYRTRIYEYTP
jgi:hypothetical protein